MARNYARYQPGTMPDLRAHPDYHVESQTSVLSRPRRPRPLMKNLRRLLAEANNGQQPSEEEPSSTKMYSPNINDRSWKEDLGTNRIGAKQGYDSRTELRRTSEKRKVATNWSEDAVSMFEGASINTWQALAKFSKRCSDWPLAQEALKCVKAERVRRPQLGSSARHSWTKSDVEKAQKNLEELNDIDNYDDVGSHDGNDSRQGQLFEIFENPVTSQHLDNVSDGSSSLKRPCRSLPQSAPFKKQPRLPNVSKQSLTMTSNNDDGDVLAVDSHHSGPPWGLVNRDVARFLGDAWWNDTVMFSILQFLQTLVDPQLVRLVDPLLVLRAGQGQVSEAEDYPQFPLSSPQRLVDIPPSAQVLFPLCVADEHWVAVRIRPGWKNVDVFDSKFNRDYYDEACRRIRHFFEAGLGQVDEPHFAHSAPIGQENSDDCGPITMIVIAHCAFNESIDPHVDPKCCRRLFYHLVCDEPEDTRETVGLSTRYVSLDRIEGGRVALDLKSVLDHLYNLAAYLEGFRRAVGEASGSSTWTVKALALVSEMQKASTKRDEIPQEVEAGLSRAEDYLKRKVEEEACYENIDYLLKTMIPGHEV